MGANKANLKIAAATSMVIFVLFACFAGSAAWFKMKTESNHSGDGFSVDSESSLNIVSAYAVRYSGNYGAEATNLFVNPNVEMSEYDYIFTDRNVNTPLFLRLELSQFTATNDLVITVPCTGAYKDSESGPVKNNLSNVVCAKFLHGIKEGGTIVKDTYTWTGDSVGNASVKASYNGMLARAADQPGTPFVVSSAKTSNSITLTMPAAAAFDPAFITTVDGEQRTIVYIEFDYYVTSTINLVNAYIDSYHGAAHSLSFVDDIGTIFVKN